VCRILDHQSATHAPGFENIIRGGTSVDVLAARAGMTHQSMGELVRSMERLGYLESRVDPSDGRARLGRADLEPAETPSAMRIGEIAESNWRGWSASAAPDSTSISAAPSSLHSAPTSRSTWIQVRDRQIHLVRPDRVRKRSTP